MRNTPTSAGQTAGTFKSYCWLLWMALLWLTFSLITVKSIYYFLKLVGKKLLLENAENLVEGKGEGGVEAGNALASNTPPSFLPTCLQIPKIPLTVSYNWRFKKLIIKDANVLHWLMDVLSTNQQYIATRSFLMEKSEVKGRLLRQDVTQYRKAAGMSFLGGAWRRKKWNLRKTGLPRAI